MQIRLWLLAVLALVCCPVLLAEAQTQSAPGKPETPPAAPPAADVVAQPAKPHLERPTRWGEPTEVKIGIYVIDVDTIDSANQNFSASVYYEANWKSPLLSHKGPGPKIVPTTAVWTPRLAIVNQQQAWNAFPSQVEIYPDGGVVFRQKTWGWFSQPLDLRHFPLDRQTLGIQVIASGILQTEVTMLPLLKVGGRGSGIAETFSLPDFKVLSSHAEPRAYVPFHGVAGVAGFIMEIRVARNAGYFIWKLILPLCLIVAMSWVPRWIATNEVGTAISIAATSFLTLVAYLFATAVLLPRVSYFTRMDLFILLATLMVFVSLVQTVMTPLLAQWTGATTLSRIDVASRILYPLVLIAVLGFSFG